MTRWYEEVEPGQKFALGAHTFSVEEIVAFGKDYDPQYFHTDPEAAKHSHFGGLVASGWHTISVGQRMMVEATLAESAERRKRGEVTAEPGPSPGVNFMKFFVPVRPGDTISYSMGIIGKRVSKSLPGWGVVTSSLDGTNQNSQDVYHIEFAYLAKRRDYRPSIATRFAIWATLLTRRGLRR